MGREEGGEGKAKGGVMGERVGDKEWGGRRGRRGR